MHKTTGERVRSVVVVLVAMIVAVVLFSGQTTKTTPKSRKAPITKAARAKATADSIAAFRADSTQKTLRAIAVADSIRQQQYLDSLALWREDSLKIFQLRKINNDAFGVGERLVFEVSYGFINAGEAVMAVAAYDSIAGRKCYRVEFTVTSHPSFNWIYKVEDRYLTYIDVEAIAPWKFEQHIREGTYRRDFIAEFDQIHHVARTTEGEYPIPEYVHDIMSAFYFCRTIDFSNYKVGDGVMLSNFYKDKSHELMVRFLGRQELEVEAGTFNTIVVEPLVKEGGLFKSEGRIVIWLSDDERKIPVRVNTKVVIGSIDTELKSYSGLIGPLRAKIQ
ncbi:MAG: hypothetical protein HW407_1610 [Bacteroidetes bacterium]|nr:hypothetical protein [Bacteroidota bacterium]